MRSSADGASSGRGSQRERREDASKEIREPCKEMGAVGLSVNSKPGKNQRQWEAMTGIQ